MPKYKYTGKNPFSSTTFKLFDIMPNQIINVNHYLPLKWENFILLDDIETISKNDKKNEFNINNHIPKIKTFTIPPNSTIYITLEPNYDTIIIKPISISGFVKIYEESKNNDLYPDILKNDKFDNIVFSGLTSIRKLTKLEIISSECDNHSIIEITFKN